MHIESTVSSVHLRKDVRFLFVRINQDLFHLLTSGVYYFITHLLTIYSLTDLENVGCFFLTTKALS